MRFTIGICTISVAKAAAILLAIGNITRFLRWEITSNYLDDVEKFLGFDELEDFDKTNELELEKINDHEYNRHEARVFQSMLNRSSIMMATCKNLTKSWIPKPKAYDSGVSALPEFGIHTLLQDWISQDDKSKINGGNGENITSYPTCYLPPTKTCNASLFSIVLMSHSLERVNQALISNIEQLAQRTSTGEIILVWNGQKSLIAEALISQGKDAQSKHTTALLRWHDNTDHPLRIFYAVDDHNLTNNLLNRYHPLIQPKHDAILYFDDDGPFFSERAMEVGFELWKRNSDRQVGSFPRNLRVTSNRLQNLQKNVMERAIKWEEDGDDAVGRDYPSFLPTCHNETGENVEYNFFVFPTHMAHMVLPSGSFLHKNYLCFIWHPAFNELRQYVLDHPTHADDQTISALVSHLNGKAIRTFSRKLQPSKNRRLKASVDINTLVDNDQSVRRRLLWQQKDWGKMREEAINSIIGYFGSMNPGSVGWCAGTQYQMKNRKGVYTCVPEFPTFEMVPWMHKGGLGNDQCP